MVFNPELGSTSPAVLLDNAERLDKLLNGDAATVPDRAGQPLDSWRLMLQTFAAIVENTRENLIPLGKQYTDLSKAQADIANIPDGAVIYVLSPLSDVLADEYKNISGVLTTTGKQMAAKGYTDNVINSLKSSGLIPEVMNPETGYVLAFRDPESKRSCILVTVTGQVEIPLLQYQNGSIERPALQEEIQRLIPMTLDPSTGYIMAWIDPVT
ncbi:TPA: flagellar biosynthesis protein, partial [Klebsiella pneumoniae]